MSESSSTSKGPIVAKILIDLSEYKALKKAKEFQEKHEKHLSQKYEEEVKSGGQQGDVVEDEKLEVEGAGAVATAPVVANPPIQVGLGASDLKVKTHGANSVNILPLRAPPAAELGAAPPPPPAYKVEIPEIENAFPAPPAPGTR
jgi:hypothetical protein